MSRIRFLLATVFILALALAPGLALARAGSGGSMGSRGSMTYSAPPSTTTAPYSAAPMQRSMTPNTPNYGSQTYAPAFGGGGGFMSGLMGGLIGAGIGGMLFGHGFFGGMHGFGFFGLILQLLIIYWIGRFIYRTFFSGQPVLAGGPGLFARGGMPNGGMGGGMQGSAGSGGNGMPPIQITADDYRQFEQLLKGIQAAWSARDLNGLQAMATPEMVGYFNEQLSDQASRGVRNVVGDVVLERGDLAQAWAENRREYATVAMRFSMTDATYDQAGRVVDGSATEHVTATEIWTFVRAPGGHWVLSAIQQAR
jgi:predicted lipid-binding transport protein (Tim44 family)